MDTQLLAASAVTSTGELSPADLTVIIAGQEREFRLAQFGLNFNSEPEVILNTINGIVREELGTEIKDDDGNWIMTVQKVTESNRVYVFPKSPAGNNNWN